MRRIKVKKYDKGGGVKKPIGTEKEVKEFYSDYLTSPNYRQRLIQQGYQNPDQVILDRLSNVLHTPSSYTNNTPIGSLYSIDEHNVSIDTGQLKNYNLNPNSLWAHEYSHAAGSIGMTGMTPDLLGNMQLSSKEISEIDKRNFLNEPDVRQFYNSPTDEHDRQAGEFKADIDALRFRLKKDKIYNTGTQTFDQKTLDKAKELYKTDPVFNRLYYHVKSDDDLIYLMNSIAQNSSSKPLNQAAKGGKIERYDDGGKAKKKSHELPPVTVYSKADPAYKRYQDSLKIYNEYEEPSKRWNGGGPPAYVVGKTDYNTYAHTPLEGDHYAPVEYSDAFRHSSNEKEMIEFMRKSDFPDTHETPISFQSDADGVGLRYPRFAKPVMPVIYKDPRIHFGTAQLADLRTQIQMHTPQSLDGNAQDMFSMPDGKPVYGPANSMIGVYSNNQFTPVRDYGRYKVNPQDQSLLENPDKLKAFMNQKVQGMPLEIKADGGDTTLYNHNKHPILQYVDGHYIDVSVHGQPWVDSVIQAPKNVNKNFLQRFINPSQYPVMNNPDGSVSTESMASDGTRAFPTVIQRGKGQPLERLPNGDPAWNYADSTKEFINFKNEADADWFASNGYKLSKSYIPQKAEGGKITNKTMKIKIKKKPHHTPPPEDADMLDEMKNGGHWIQGAVNPDHKGYCTPMTKSTCTGKRRAFAETMKKHHGFHKKAYGGPIDDPGKKAPEGASVIGNPYPHVTQVTYPGDTLTNEQLMYAKAQMGRMKDYLPADMVYAAQFDKKGNQQTGVSYQYGHPHSTDAFMYKLSPTDLAKMSDISSELIKNPNIGFLPAPKAKGGIVRYGYGGPNDPTGPGWVDALGRRHPMIDSTYRGNGIEVTPPYTPPGTNAPLPSMQPVNPYSASRNDQSIGGGRFGGGSTGQPTPQRTINRNNPSGDPQGFNPWMGDKHSGVHNESAFGSSAEIEQTLRSIGYDGPADNKSAQYWLMQNYPDAVTDIVKALGMPRGNHFNDGRWGYRTDMAVMMAAKKKNDPWIDIHKFDAADPAPPEQAVKEAPPVATKQPDQGSGIQPPYHQGPGNGFSDMDYLSMADAFFSPIKKFYPIRVQNKFTPNRWFDVDMSAQRQDIKGQTTEANRAAAMIGNPSQVGASLASGIKGQALDALNQVDQQEFNTNQQGRFQTQVGNNAGFDQVYNQNQQFSSEYNDKMNALGQQVLEDKGFKRQQELLALQNAVKNRSSRQLLSQLAPNFPIGRNFDVSFMANPQVFQQLISRGGGQGGSAIVPPWNEWIRTRPDIQAIMNTPEGLRQAQAEYAKTKLGYERKGFDFDENQVPDTYGNPYYSKQQ